MAPNEAGEAAQQPEPTFADLGSNLGVLTQGRITTLAFVNTEIVGESSNGKPVCANSHGWVDIPGTNLRATVMVMPRAEKARKERPAPFFKMPT